MATLRALSTVVFEPRVRIPEAELKAMREMLFENDFQRLIQAFPGRHVAPLDILILRERPQRLSDIAYESRIRRCDPGCDCCWRVNIRAQYVRTQGQHGRIVHVGRNSEPLPVVS